MSKKVLEDILGNKTRLKILRFLALHPGEYSGRRIARDAGVNHWQANKALKLMAAGKIVKLRHMAGSHMYSVNNENRIVESMLMPLFMAEAGLPGKSAGAKGMKKLNLFEKAKIMLMAEGAEKVAVFGSYAAGRQTKKSDLDLLVTFKSPKSLMEHAAIERRLSGALGIKVDLITEGALSPHMADKVHEEMTVIYG